MMKEQDDLFSAEFTPNMLPDELEAEKIKHILNSLSDAISLHDIQGKILYMSPSSEKIHGYTPEDLLTLGELYAVYPEDIESIKQVIQKVSVIRCATRRV
jgi:PAS domain S-box-containing protein